MRTARIVSASVLAASVLTFAALSPACGGGGGSGSNPGFGSSGGGSGSGGSGGGSGGGGSGSGGVILPPAGGDGGPTIASCPNGGTTTISGTVYDPAKKNPLYGVAVYVPSGAPTALTPGASCDSCDSLYTGTPAVASALTDTAGKFTIPNAPSGTDVPLVIQIGKWRKQLKLAKVAPCIDNPQPDKSLSLPSKGSEGDIPSIAISTGGQDSLECLLARVGLDPSEYTGGPGGTGHIHIFEGTSGGVGLNPATMSPAALSSASLWDSKPDLMKYDIVLLSCEGGETGAMNQAALDEYTKAGGRVFASHFHYAWLNSGPFGAYNLASWTTGAKPIQDPANAANGTIDAVIDQTLAGGGVFPKGVALAKWLGVVGALGANGDLPIAEAKHNADLTAGNTHSQSWIHSAPTTSPAGATQYFSFNTPVNAPMGDAGPEYCGRVVYSDLHVGAAPSLGGADYDGGVGQGGTVPTGCTSRDLSPQEKALEFMLFDLSSCVIPDNQPPPLPK